MASLSDGDDLAVRSRIRDADWVFALIAVTFAVRIAFASTLGLGIDEAYTVATARSFALSTYDHPPLAWWLAGGARWLFGTEAAPAVRLPFMVLFALSTWLMFALTRLLFGSRAGLLASLTLNFAPVLAWSSGTFVLPVDRTCGGSPLEPVAALHVSPSCTACSFSPAPDYSC